MKDEENKNNSKKASIFRKIAAAADVSVVSGTFLTAWLAVEPLSGAAVALGGIAISSLIKRGAEERENAAIEDSVDALRLQFLAELQGIRLTLNYVFLLSAAFFMAYVFRNNAIGEVVETIMALSLFVVSVSILWPEKRWEVVITSLIAEHYNTNK